MTKSQSTKNIDVYIGQKLRIRRMSLGISQEAIAKELSLTFQQIQKYEKGTNRISAARLFSIAKILNISVEYFFEGLPEAMPEGTRDQPQMPVGTAYILSTPEAKRLYVALQNIQDDKVRHCLIDFIDMLSVMWETKKKR